MQWGTASCWPNLRFSHAQLAAWNKDCHPGHGGPPTLNCKVGCWGQGRRPPPSLLSRTWGSESSSRTNPRLSSIQWGYAVSLTPVTLVMLCRSWSWAEHFGHLLSFSSNLKVVLEPTVGCTLNLKVVYKMSLLGWGTARVLIWPSLPGVGQCTGKMEVSTGVDASQLLRGRSSAGELAPCPDFFSWLTWRWNKEVMSKGEVKRWWGWEGYVGVQESVQNRERPCLYWADSAEGKQAVCLGARYSVPDPGLGVNMLWACSLYAGRGADLFQTGGWSQWRMLWSSGSTSSESLWVQTFGWKALQTVLLVLAARPCVFHSSVSPVKFPGAPLGGVKQRQHVCGWKCISQQSGSWEWSSWGVGGWEGVYFWDILLKWETLPGERRTWGWSWVEVLSPAEMLVCSDPPGLSLEVQLAALLALRNEPSLGVTLIKVWEGHERPRYLMDTKEVCGPQ